MPYDLNALVVDDDDHVRTFLVVLMRKLVSGSIGEARNGREAIDYYEAQRPQLVILDVNMPILDGMDALTHIRKVNPEAVVIMITSLAMRRVVEVALHKGASNFIRKDTPRARMVEIIIETIEMCLAPALSPEPAAAGAPVPTDNP